MGNQANVIWNDMIKVSGDQERSVYGRLQKNPEARDIYRLFGEYSFFLAMLAEEKCGLSRMLRDLQFSGEHHQDQFCPSH